MDECDRRQLPPELRLLFDDDGVERALPADLPDGQVVWPDPSFARLPSTRSPTRPAFWLSDEPVSGELWAKLRAAHAETGLWPLLLEDSMQPWSTGQVAPDAPALIDNFEAGAFMREVWSDWLAQAHPDQIEDLYPFGRECPGLAEPGVPVAEPNAVADWYACVLAERRPLLGLAAASRGADALVVMGWQGAVNHNEWVVPMAAVVRSWEDRFGARVVGVGFNTLELSVAAPPVTPEHAVRVAAEHWTFCPDNIIQGPGNLVDYGEQLLGKYFWSFWWD
jgi:hypothetical protein